MIAKAEQRQGEIIKLVEENTYCTFPEIAKALDVTTMTIRRDAKSLAEQGKLKATLGGLMAVAHITTNDRLAQNSQAKKSIAAACKQLIIPGSTLFADAGSTVYCCLEALGQIENLTIITYDEKHLHLYKQLKCAEFYISGGRYVEAIQHFSGPFSEMFLKNFSPDFALISASSINMQGLLGCHMDHEIALKNIMLAQAQRSIFVADHSKFSEDSFLTFNEISAVDVLITDSPPPEHLATSILAAEINVIVADQ